MSCLDAYLIGEAWSFTADIKSGSPPQLIGDISSANNGGPHKAIVTDKDDNVLIPELTITETPDWVNSRLVFTFPSASTVLVTYTGIARVYVQVQINSAAETWGYYEFEISTGLFS